MIFLGPAKAVGTVLIFLGIKFGNTDIFGFSQDFCFAHVKSYNHTLLYNFLGTR